MTSATATLVMSQNWGVLTQTGMAHQEVSFTVNMTGTSTLGYACPASFTYEFGFINNEQTNLQEFQNGIIASTGRSYNIPAGCVDAMWNQLVRQDELYFCFVYKGAIAEDATTSNCSASGCNANQTEPTCDVGDGPVKLGDFWRRNCQGGSPLYVPGTPVCKVNMNCRGIAQGMMDRISFLLDSGYCDMQTAMACPPAAGGATGTFDCNTFWQTYPKCDPTLGTGANADPNCKASGHPYCINVSSCPCSPHCSDQPAAPGN